MGNNKKEYITNVEVIITFEYGGTRLVDLDSEDKKVIISMLANYFRDGIPTSEFDATKSERTSE